MFSLAGGFTQHLVLDHLREKESKGVGLLIFQQINKQINNVFHVLECIKGIPLKKQSPWSMTKGETFYEIYGAIRPFSTSSKKDDGR